MPPRNLARDLLSKRPEASGRAAEEEKGNHHNNDTMHGSHAQAIDTSSARLKMWSMRLVMRRIHLCRLLMGTNVAHTPTFRMRDELFRLVHGQRSVRNVDVSRVFVELDLQRVFAVEHPDAVIVLRPRDVQGGEAPMYVKGKRLAAV